VVAAEAAPRPPGEEPPMVTCPAVLRADINTDKAVYHPGDTVKISGMFTGPDGVDEDGLVKLEWNNSNNTIRRATATVVPRHNDCSTDFVCTHTLGADVQHNIGTWSIRGL
jgi:hypothetical protein